MGMKEDKFKATALHLASVNGHQAIVEVLLHAFSGEKKENLIEYLMKKNDDKESALHLASENGHENIVKLLSQKLINATNEKILCDLQQVTQIFKNETQMKKRNPFYGIYLMIT